ncbi:LysR family transcriptional regulator [Salipaludibacillus neizhouensis]|uniref:LysR family transcriptional regulator n=1 Tax=Salipaludibacillus neizhouensis TaxID=885475 RepID=A0A3A9KIZ6_9BACI|nr:LysR family transcriptional regulator [Salipaludibacillus neizhouensis]RKL64856.1 LysR family transcriptional regulator [Salipaludibacillus neizhouensis]
MELLYFKTFAQVVKSGNYTRAAYALDYAQSSVTTHIQKLEEIYGGIRLLERHGKSMELTPAGELLYSYVEKMLSLYEESHQRLSTQEVKTVRVGSIETLAIYELPNILAEFKKKYPDVMVQIIPDSEEIIIEKIYNKDLDFGLIIDKPFKSERINSLSLKKQAMQVVVPPDHAFTKEDFITIDDFKNETIILTEEGCTYRAYLLKQLERNHIDFTLSMELSSIETIKKAIQNKWGVGFLPAFSIKGHEEVVGMPFQDENFQFYSQLLYRKSSSHGSVYQYLISLFQKA